MDPATATSVLAIVGLVAKHLRDWRHEQTVLKEAAIEKERIFQSALDEKLDARVQREFDRMEREIQELREEQIRLTGRIRVLESYIRDNDLPVPDHTLP